MDRKWIMVLALSLAGCSGSGWGDFAYDSSRLPGKIPNAPQGSAEQAVLTGTPQKSAPVYAENQEEWPGPPKPIPTVQELQRQQNAEMSSGSFQPHPLSQDLPQVPGYKTTPPANVLSSPAGSFPTGVVNGVDNKQIGTLGGAEGTHAVPQPNAHGDIVIHNSDGSTTVIRPDGSVSTTPASK